MGAALYSWYKHGVLKSEGTSITEGIGQGRMTANLEGAPVDEAFQIPDQEAIPVVFDLLEHEGLLMGRPPASTSRAPSVLRVSSAGSHHRDDPRRRRTALCEPAFQSEFLRSKNLPVPPWLEGARIQFRRIRNAAGRETHDPKPRIYCTNTVPPARTYSAIHPFRC